MTPREREEVRRGGGGGYGCPISVYVANEMMLCFVFWHDFTVFYFFPYIDSLH